jgi:hypothetical protein
MTADELTALVHHAIAVAALILVIVAVVSVSQQ